MESSDREPEMGTGESRRGGGGRGGRGRKDPRVDRQKGSDSGWTQRKPSRGDDGPPGRKYEEPPQPVSPPLSAEISQCTSLSPRPSVSQVGMLCWKWRNLLKEARKG